MAIERSKVLLRKRAQEINKLLKPLSKNHYLSSQQAYSPRGTIIFACFGGKQPKSTNHRDWFFSTHKNNLTASYFEVWNEIPNDLFILEKAYLMLNINDDNENNELLSLHIDPNEKDNKYKKGPHIHIKTNNDIISKAHISLNMSDLEQVINSFEKFNVAYKNAILMINEEILKITTQV